MNIIFNYVHAWVGYVYMNTMSIEAKRGGQIPCSWKYRRL